MSEPLNSYATELKSLILEKAVLRAPKGKPFTLASGAKSDIYLDVRRVTMDPDGLHLIALLVNEYVDSLYDGLDGGWCRFHAIAGPAIGADPIVAGVMLLMRAQEEISIYGAMIRSAPKDHGLQRQIEGQDFKAGDNVLLVEDTVTSGESLLKAAEAVRATGAEVAHAWVVVDRQAGAVELLAKHGITLSSAFTLEDLGLPVPPAAKPKPLEKKFVPPKPEDVRYQGVSPFTSLCKVAAYVAGTQLATDLKDAEVDVIPGGLAIREVKPSRKVPAGSIVVNTEFLIASDLTDPPKPKKPKLFVLGDAQTTHTTKAAARKARKLTKAKGG